MRVRPRRGSWAKEIGDSRGVIHENCTVRKAPVQRHVGSKKMADLGRGRVLGGRCIGVDHRKDEGLLTKGRRITLERHGRPQCVLYAPKNPMSSRGLQRVD